MKTLYEEKKMEQRRFTPRGAQSGEQVLPAGRYEHPQKRSAVKYSPSPAMMITEEDVEELIYQWRYVLKWIKAHVITKYPAHRYEGDLMIDGRYLIFRGHDIKENEDYELRIPLDCIDDVYIGFSEHLKASIDPSFGIGGPVPCAVRYQSDGGEQTAYFNTYFDHYPIHILSANREWYETLKNITSHNSQRKLRGEGNKVLVAAGL